jgi:uncharacterized protein with ParB-like and HNH nuclease domain
MKNSSNSFRRFVKYLNNSEQEGGYWLPNIQRPFVWKEEQVERLFDSILREYPIGTLLVWKTKSNIRRRRFIDNYRDGIKLSDFYIPEDTGQKMLVLDGQQRLQSLFIGLIGSYEGKELCLDLLSGELAAPDDIKYKFKFLNPKEIFLPWIKIKDIVFSTKEANLISKELKPKFVEPLSTDEETKLETIVNKVNRIFNSEDNLLYQVVDNVDNTDLYNEDDVVEIFIRANSGGTLLGKSDLLFSLLTSSWDDAERNMEDLLFDLNKTGFKFERDFILKTCLTLLDKGASYNVEKFRDNKTKTGIEKNWKDISDAIKDVKDFIYGKTFIHSHSVMPSYLGLIPLIYFRYHYKNKWRDVKNVQEYLLRTLLAGAFSGSPDSLIDKCVKRINDTSDFDTSVIFETIREEGRNLEISQETILSIHYDSKEIHLLFNLWYNFNYQPAYDGNKPQIDHIFPQSKLKEIKVPSPETGRAILKYKIEARNQFGNLMLLTATENGSSGKTDKLPEEWFADKSNEYLEMHLIPQDKELWQIENYEKFVEARKQLILQKFNYLVIKKSKDLGSPVLSQNIKDGELLTIKKPLRDKHYLIQFTDAIGGSKILFPLLDEELVVENKYEELRKHVGIGGTINIGGAPVFTEYKLFLNPFLDN